jgi:hypothetical protein
VSTDRSFIKRRFQLEFENQEKGNAACECEKQMALPSKEFDFNELESRQQGRRKIMTTRNAVRRLMTVATLGILCFVFSTATKAANDDSAQISALLSQAKMDSIRLREDSNQLKDFVGSEVAWDTYSVHTGMIADDIVAMQETIARLDKARSAGSAWQQTAIDKIKPLMKEFAATMEELSKIMLEKPMDRSEFNEYLQANFDNAEQLTALISDFVDYGKAKHRLETSAAKLKLETKTN